MINKQIMLINTKKELLNALYPFRRITWIRQFVKTVKNKHTIIPDGPHHTERFLLALYIAFCLHLRNHSSLARYGKPLKSYLNHYIEDVPVSAAPLIVETLRSVKKRYAA